MRDRGEAGSIFPSGNVLDSVVDVPGDTGFPAESCLLAVDLNEADSDGNRRGCDAECWGYNSESIGCGIPTTDNLKYLL